ncbi:glycosyltransferase family 61 protein [Brevibacterium litoralis]|uniref:glycosyltransferase family 61 protein n=1 Tax=Brevibacterium litoralis TaxID=3138935 RepID=UPI0032EBB4D4
MNSADLNPVKFRVPTGRSNVTDIPAEPIELTDAVLTHFKVFHPGQPENCQGAVYTSDLKLVEQSLRRRGPNQKKFVPNDPTSLNPMNDATSHIPGSWLYGGNWMNHFGHFVIEALPAIGHVRHDKDGILCHPFIWKGEPSSWQRELLRLAGWDKATPIRIVRGPEGSRVRVERMHVETPPVTLGLVASPRAVRLWQEVAEHATSEASNYSNSYPLVYFSRTGLKNDNRFTRNDRVLEDKMADRGFHVVHPQELTIVQQISLAANAEVIAGIAGSNLLLTAFSPPKTKIIEIGNRRNPTQGQHMQRVLSAATGHLHAFLPYFGSARARNVVPTLRQVDLLLN